MGLVDKISGIAQSMGMSADDVQNTINKVTPANRNISENSTESSGGLMSRIREYLPEAAIGVGVALLYQFGNAYAAPIYESRLQQFIEFYQREAKGDLKASHGDELASIIVYGNPYEHRNNPNRRFKLLHAALTPLCAIGSLADNVPFLGAYLSQRLMNSGDSLAQGAQQTAENISKRMIGSRRTKQVKNAYNNAATNNTNGPKADTG